MNGFIFYRSFFDAIKDLPDEVRLQAYDAICNYGIDGVETDVEGFAKSILAMAKPQIDANAKRRENGKKGGEYGTLGTDYGKLGGRPKTPHSPVTETPHSPVIDNPPKEKEKVKEKEKEKVKEKEKEKEKEKVKVKEKQYFPNDEKLDESFKGYVESRRQLKKPMTDRAIDLAIKELGNLSGGDSEIAIKIIDQSVINGWQGLFPLRNKGSTTQNRIEEVDKWV